MPPTNPRGLCQWGFVQNRDRLSKYSSSAPASAILIATDSAGRREGEGWRVYACAEYSLHTMLGPVCAEQHAVYRGRLWRQGTADAGMTGTCAAIIDWISTTHCRTLAPGVTGFLALQHAGA